MADEVVRVGLIGAGRNTRERHLPGFQKIAGVEVVAVANRSRESGQVVADSFNISTVYDNWRDLLEDPTIDAVCIGTWPYMHSTLTLAALDKGKHVLCEKPMALSVAEGKQMIEAAHQAGCKLMIGHMWRFDREIIWLRDVVASGKLGQIFKVKSHEVLIYDIFGEDPSTKSWFVKRALAGVAP